MQKIYQRQSQKQVQKLELKPKMLQTLNMMQMPLMQLSQFLKNELITNPLLEIKEEDQDDLDSMEDLEDLESEEETLDEANELSEILDDWNKYHSGSEHTSKSKKNQDYQIQDIIQSKENLEGAFYEQLEKLNLKENEEDFAIDLIESTDAYGFLPKDFNLIQEAEDYDLTLQKAEEIHQKILLLIPHGITARDIEECLLSQLTEKLPHYELVKKIIEFDFDNLIHKRYKKIASKYKVNEELILECKDIIAHLDPKPGLRIHSNDIKYITPDVIIKKIDGKFEVIINDYNIPNINISGHLKKFLRKAKNNKENLEYVRKKINSAKFLIKSIYMRNKTLERVTKLIIKHQHEYFYKETGILKPLTYAVIADELHVNESTISRVVTKKYADTPFGLKCLKEFFTTSAGKNKNYTSVSKQQIQQIMLELIEHEDNNKPLSDKAIVDTIRERGIKVSRRLIAKYRKALGILNSRLRRKE